jgi:hypothetical protein
MSDRNKPHNGRDRSGNFRVKQEDFDDKVTDPSGPEFVADDVRLGGAVADTGPQAGQRAEHLQEMIDEDREITDKLADYNRGL